jgi:hypothetical protein
VSQAKAVAGGHVRTSLDNTWRTPEKILERVRVYFGGDIPLDPASGPDNPTRALRFFTGAEPSSAPVPGLFTEVEDLDALARARVCGLATPWDAPVWCNPPYGRELRAWLKKMIAEGTRGTEIIALLPTARWEQPYLHDALRAALHLCLIRGRVDFISSIDGQPVRGNPSGSMLLGYCTSPARFSEAFSPLGACFEVRSLFANGGAAA